MRNLFLLLPLPLLLFSCDDETSYYDPGCGPEDDFAPTSLLSYAGNLANTDSLNDSITFDMGRIADHSLTFMIEQVIVCKDADLTQSNADTLYPGVPVVILKTVGENISGNWGRPVFLIRYQGDQEIKEGYISLKGVSVSNSFTADSNLLLYGFTGLREGKEGVVKGLAVVIGKNNQVLASCEVDPIGGDGFDQAGEVRYNYTVWGHLNDSMGLSGIRNVLDLEMYYPACGYAGGNVHLFWTGESLVNAFMDYDMGDAGAYSVYSSPIFPKDGKGMKNAVLCVTNQVEYDGTEEMKESNHDSIVVKYTWDPKNGLAKGDTIFKQNMVLKK